MRLVALASSLHKWLALLVGVQVLLWFVSGAFFAFYPIERVRSEHRIAHAEAVPLDGSLFAGMEVLATALPEQPTKVTFERNAAGQGVAVAEFAGRRPVAIDLATKRVIPPLDEASASALATAYVAGRPKIQSIRWITKETAEYRGALPAWRVAFEDDEGLAVYVAADTGRITARRSDLWRLYDALWALHIMDWRDHENFNNGLLLVTALLSLLVTVAGLVLLPYRLRLPLPRGRSSIPRA